MSFDPNAPPPRVRVPKAFWRSTFVGYLIGAALFFAIVLGAILVWAVAP
jgi:hypothetical protein